MWWKKTAQKELRENWFATVSRIRLDITWFGLVWLVLHLYHSVLIFLGEAPCISLCGIRFGIINQKVWNLVMKMRLITSVVSVFSLFPPFVSQGLRVANGAKDTCQDQSELLPQAHTMPCKLWLRNVLSRKFLSPPGSPLCFSIGQFVQLHKLLFPQHAHTEHKLNGRAVLVSEAVRGSCWSYSFPEHIPMNMVSHWQKREKKAWSWCVTWPEVCYWGLKVHSLSNLPISFPLRVSFSSMTSWRHIEMEGPTFQSNSKC